MLPLEGWITHETAQDLFRRAGLDYAKEKQAANRPGFHAVAMAGESLGAHLSSRIAHQNSRNVVGVLPGSARPNDYFIYTAHWDHLGIKPGPPGADKIHN